MDTFLLLGILGMICILFGFIMNNIGKWKNDDLIYDIINFLGSVLLIIYAWTGRAYPFLILNTIWALFSLRDIFKDAKKIGVSSEKKFHHYKVSGKN